MQPVTVIVNDDRNQARFEDRSPTGRLWVRWLEDDGVKVTVVGGDGTSASVEFHPSVNGGQSAKTWRALLRGLFDAMARDNHELPQLRHPQPEPEPEPKPEGYFSHLSPAEHVMDCLPELEVKYASEHLMYNSLPVLRSVDDSRRCVSRWTLTPEQRQAVMAGCDIFLEQATFALPLQPVRLAVGDGKMRRGQVLSLLGIHMSEGQG